LIPLLGIYITGLKSMEGSQDTSIREGFTGFWEEMVIGIEKPQSGPSTSLLTGHSSLLGQSPRMSCEAVIIL